MRENAGKMGTRITPNTDTFCAVFIDLNVHFEVNHSAENKNLLNSIITDVFRNQSNIYDGLFSVKIVNRYTL